MPSCTLAAAAAAIVLAAAFVACFSGVHPLPVATAFVTTAPHPPRATGASGPTRRASSAGAGRSGHIACVSSTGSCLLGEGNVGSTSDGVGFGDIHRRSFLADALTTIVGVACTCTAVAPALADDDAGSSSVTGIGPAATYAYRSGGLPSLRPLGIGLLQRYEGYVEAPPASARKQLFVTFDFPSDWLQLDKLGGGVQYVDQRNGDKLYVLRARLPEGKSLIDVPKSFFAESIFDPRGDIVRSGTVVEGGKTSKSTILNDCTSGSSTGSTGTPTTSECMNRRRLTLKYDTVTGSGVQTVERRALVDAYEVDGDVYMLVTSSNAVKFEAKGKERDTVEAIVASFRVAI